jgi:hypothetical protein
LTQTRAATAAARRTAALPVSVWRNDRRGVCRLRAQAVVPENVGRLSEPALLLMRATSFHDLTHRRHFNICSYSDLVGYDRKALNRS